MKLKKTLKILISNLCFFVLFLFVAEIILGSDYRSANSSRNDIKNARKFIPKLICDKKLKYDASQIYKSKVPYLISYNRDEQCYRSYKKDNLPIILTIGGSTTDQRYVTEGETFQDILEIKLKNRFDVINGGVDGQTTFGHIKSMEKWHSKYLSEQNIEMIIFYIGVNDTNFVNKFFDYGSEKYTFARRFKDFISNKSYIYTFIKNAYLAKNFKTNGVLAAAHGAGFKFNLSEKIFEVDQIQPKIKKQYSNLFEILLKSSKDYFPEAKIYIVQQQAPACDFITEKTFRSKLEDISYCNNIGKVFLAQQETIRDIDNYYKPKLLKMYIEDQITEDGIYDMIHTNNIGSKQIANYLLKNIF